MPAVFLLAGSIPSAGAAAPPASGRQSIVGALSVSPTSGPVGSQVTLREPAGSFPAGAQAVVNFQDSSQTYAGVLVGRTTINADGSLTFPLRLPDEASAGQALLFLTVNGTSSSTTFTIQPSIRLSATTVPGGGALVVTGSGFSSVGAATFQVNGQDAQVLTNDAVVIDSFGSFSGFVEIPGNLRPGPANLSATDGTYTATAQITIGGALGSGSTAPILGAPTSSSPTATAVIGGTASPTATAVISGTTPITPPVLIGNTSAYFAEGYTGDAATNGKATYTEWLDILNPNPIDATVSITYVVQGAAAPVPILRTVPGNSVLRELVNDDVGPEKQVSAIITSPQRVFVSRTIARISAAGKRLDSSTTQPTASPGRSWLFPEGYTGASFQEYLTLLNPGSATAKVAITLAPQSTGAKPGRTVTVSVPGLSRATANIRALNAGSTAQSVGLVVHSNQPIVAERVLYFGAGSGSGKFGTTVSGGVSAPAQVLAMVGVGGAAQSFITLLNPAAAGAPITATARLADAAGKQVGTPLSVAISAGRRQTIIANQTPGAAGPVSILIGATGPIAAESAQYFGGSPNVGSHPGVAYPAQGAAAHTVFVPDLSTALDDSTPVTRTVYLYNPGAAPITVNAFYDGVSGSGAQITYTVLAGGIITVNVNQDAALPAGPIGGIFTVAGSNGALVVSALGITADGRSATENVGVPGA
ncbi:MAG TPA: hypothetical protein VN837_07810 [Chloroflexota bacterium]|nr:hypothetical protein [Chloroflexota bacterium]